ncbi:GTPase Era [Gracilinema caldarium]|uniref:GTPase Era n=1 Tax=Gracilinema caldarium TaxID=215591 RepID=UPI0026ED52CD|nr:GTPase Era [Gracilinema caldarium]
MAEKAAFVAVVGRPSAGKSTLINTLCGQKVSIVSSVPQTTRNMIRGIVNREMGQLVFVDTPGRHISEKKLNRKLVELADRALEESELVLYLIDASRPMGAEEEELARAVQYSRAYPDRTVIAINKVDDKRADPATVHTFLKEKLPGIPEERRREISAKNGTGVQELLQFLFALAPEGPRLYPEDTYTDQDVQFRIAEIIREKAINNLREELPHSIYVDVADTELRNDGQRLWVRAFILVERESQKGIVVGKGGEMIKTIRQSAQKELNRIFDWKVELDLRVKVASDWRQNDAVLRRLIERS